MIAALRALEAELNATKPPLYAAYPHPINLNVGMIRGGDWPSTVAGECLTHFRLALLPGRARRRPAARASSRPSPGVAADQRIRIEVLYDGFQCEGYELAPDAPLITGLTDAAARVTGQRAAPVRLDGDHRRAHVPSVRRHARRLLRPERRERARSG